MPLVLASRSPQRSAILTQLGIPFTVRPADVEEASAGEPAALAKANARAKALAVDAAPGETVVGVDTIVTLDGEVFGKPSGDAEARATIARLAGRTHTVLSGLCVVTHSPAGGARVTRAVVAATDVTFRALSAAEIDAYVATEEWRGRAGGFAIQQRGGALVRAIDGDYLNVVGLPVAALLDLLPGLLPR